MLVVDGLVRHFGGVKAVDGCSFEIKPGTISALIGPNGAGKTTTVNLIAGALRSDRGRIVFNGSDLTGKRPHQIAEQGLVRTFQISREYASMTVLENLMVSPLHQSGERLLNVLFRPGRWRNEERQHLERSLEVLDEFGLYAKRDDYAGSLSGGQKRLLELARAVMAAPKMLLLDEPLAGINPALTARVADHIERLREGGITFLLVEHNLEIVERICDHVVVMALGATLATGTMADLRKNDAVVQAYLTGGGI
ncbi:MAG: ABC transporter ATP-binding protein [Actinomycetota bacterium]|nr:ABC transporter ATP-binding protein [Actinomycetota bacterium]